MFQLLIKCLSFHSKKKIQLKVYSVKCKPLIKSKFNNLSTILSSSHLPEILGLIARSILPSGFTSNEKIYYLF